MGSSCQVFYSRDIKKGTPDKLLGLQWNFISYVYKGCKQLTVWGRISIAVMTLLCRSSPCLKLRVLCAAITEMVPRTAFVIGVSQGQDYTPVYLKQTAGHGVGNWNMQLQEWRSQTEFPAGVW